MTMMEAIKKGVSVRQETITIATAIKKIHDKDYIIPSSCPRLDWSHEQKIGLIWAILVGLPLPYFLFTEKENGQLFLEDGTKRMNIIRQFLNNNMTLTEKTPVRHEEWPDISGKLFRELPEVYQKRLENFGLQVVIIPFETPKVLADGIYWNLNEHRFLYYDSGYRVGKKEGYNGGYDLGYKDGEYWA